MKAARDCALWANDRSSFAFRRFLPEVIQCDMVLPVSLQNALLVVYFFNANTGTITFFWSEGLNPSINFKLSSRTGALVHFFQTSFVALFSFCLCCYVTVISRPMPAPR